MKPLSAFSNIFCIVCIPSYGVIRLSDQKKICGWPTFSKREFLTLHITGAHLQQEIKRLKTLKLSKTHIAIPITDAQYGFRFKLPENIPNTGLHATKEQLKKAFTFGR